MSDTDAEKIRLQMRDAEEQYRESERAFEYFIDLINDSIRKNKDTFELQSLSRKEYEELKEIDHQARKSLNDLIEQRDTTRYEHRKRMEIFEEEMRQNKEGKDS